MRCPGYKHPPSTVYRPGAYAPNGLPMYGLGRCSVCCRIVALSPKSQTVVLHKSDAQRYDARVDPEWISWRPPTT